ncbi:hypothetical protein [Tropicibacter sp. Alg240-R139]|uniref:hypothetical protein n=1 Tax=Tropicibacter sp. Alg240-R139 TaxID=2305991 RepID=UPI0013DF2D86|nr:hypothetical protein [Tropicibacter sp. Alg240-R139]
MTAIDLTQPAKPIATFLHRMRAWFVPKAPIPTGTMPQTDRFARDAGLGPTDRALLQLQYPSQTTRHPML